MGALIEVIVNGIDALLLRRSEEEGLEDPRSDEAPKSMKDAIENIMKIKTAHLVILIKMILKTSLIRQLQLEFKGKTKEYLNSLRIQYLMREVASLQINFLKHSYHYPRKTRKEFSLFKENITWVLQVVYLFVQKERLIMDFTNLSYQAPCAFQAYTLIRARKAIGNEGLPVIEYFFQL